MRELDLSENVAKIALKARVFNADAVKFKNKAAARRARLASLELEKLLKQYRKESIK